MFYDIIIFTDIQSTPAWHVKPMGAYQIASVLREQGFKTKVIDWCGRILRDKELTYKLLSSFIGENTLFVGFSTTFFSTFHNTANSIDANKSIYPIDENDFAKVVQQIKDFSPNTKIVFGGANATKRNFNRFDKLADYIVEGYSDSMVVDLANHLKYGTPIKFQLLKNENKTIRVLDYDIEAKNFPFSRSITRYEFEDIITSSDVLPIEVARGCIFKCSFCSFPLIGKKKSDDYVKHYEYLESEIRRNYELFGVTKYFIVDDTFNEDTDKIKLLIDVQKNLGIKIEYTAYIRLDLIGAFPEQAELLKESGLYAAILGIETLNDKAGKSIKKGFGERRIKETLKMVKEKWGKSIHISSSFIVGLPYETEESLRQTVAWCLSHDCPLDSVAFLPFNIYKAAITPSEIYANPEKFGYTILEGGDDNGQTWTSPWLNRKRAEELAEEFNKMIQTTKKKKFVGWSMLALKQYGFTDEEINNDLNNVDWEEIFKLVDLQYKNYVENTLKFHNIN